MYISKSYINLIRYIYLNIVVLLNLFIYFVMFLCENYICILDNEIADVPINEDSDEEYRNIDLRRHYIEQRRLIDHINTSVLQQTRNSRSGRQSRRYTEHPYYIRNQSEISSINNRMHRRGRFSASNRDYNQVINYFFIYNPLFV